MQSCRHEELYLTKPLEDRLAKLTAKQKAELEEIERRVVGNFTGDFDDLKAALGILRMGHHFGWKVLVLIRNKRTRVHKRGEKPIYIWDDAGIKYLHETQHKATHKEDKAKLLWLQQFLRGKQLSEISRELIGAIAEVKAFEASPATANRFLALIRSILRKAAFEWEWIDKAPKIRFYKEAKRRIRWLSPSEVQRLLLELPQH